MIVCEKYPNKEFSWSVFSRIRIENGDLLRKFPDTGKYRPYLGTFHGARSKADDE